ncbi:hypothetical protein [Caminibacter mediatlanticus]|uniref:DUF2628 domain-containing protein n=1 Tax=Caminibacter mediatlanticus TB-2 TaxID=391592 RepID=A0AAI9F0T8_9BACT|nr:hypothetical protein [Caminibacter mediatlanticus]EDM23012.1 hypothetical protein CMTB2_08540 [Caminibacter mediatlanticus TB-2]
MNYEERMIEAFVQNPKKFEYYKEAFNKFNVNGIERVAWNWSWWGFFGNFWFLLYRKSYLGALISFIGNILFSFLPIIGPLIWYILNGGYDVYFIYKKYKKLKKEIEDNIEDEEKRIETMYILAKPNKWVIYLVAILSLIILFFIILAVISNAYYER